MVGALAAHAGLGGEHALGRLVERDRHDAGALGHLLAGSQVEGNAGPAPVVDLALERHEGLGVGVIGDALVVLVSLVLAANDIVDVDREHRTEDLVLLLVDGPGFERRRRFHRDEGEDLEEVRHDHVAEGARRLVERGAGPDLEGFGNVDLDVGDVLPVPDGLEQAVREAKRKDVLGRLLAEEVVDAEDLPLVEHLLHHSVERLGALEVGAERLLHDDPGPLREAGLAQCLDDRLRGVGRDAEVVEAPRFAAEFLLGRSDCGLQPLRASRRRHVAELAAEQLPVVE